MKPRAPTEEVQKIGREAFFPIALLTMIYACNFLDRQIVVILAETIKHDLRLTDGQIGMMTGLAFALLYSLLGIPIARWAERGDRPRIIALAVFTWSLFTALCGVATTMLQLILARVGVGIGEAGCSPPAHSLISDYVPREARASALGLYSMGTPIGSVLGLGLGGIIADAWGWRAAFWVAGAPGILLAAIVLVSLPEPRRNLDAASMPRPTTLRECFHELVGIKSFWLVAFAAAVKGYLSYGQTAFQASFFLRIHTRELAALAELFGLQPLGFLGLALGISSGFAGIAGALLGGRVADHFARYDARIYVWLPAALGVTAMPVYLIALSTASVMPAIMLLALATFLNSAWFGPVYAVTQSVVSMRNRATAAAIMLFIVNLLGLGLGPLTVGLLSDMLSASGMGPAQGLRAALMLSSLVTIASAGLFLLAARTVRQDLRG